MRISDRDNQWFRAWVVVFNHELLLVDAGDTFTGEHGRKGMFLMPVVTVSTAPVSHDSASKL